MNKKIPVSVTIITKNEENNIQNALESVSDFEDVVVLDSFSQDKTVEICKKYTDRVFQHEWLGYSKQKQLAVDHAKKDWVFILDADERITPELKYEIIEKINNNSFNGFYIPRRNFFLGKWIKYSGWWPDYTLRLFKKDASYVELREVHEKVIVNGSTGYMERPIEHFTYKSISSYLEKMENYSSLSAKELSHKKVSFLTFWMWVNPFLVFVKMFFLRQGFRDGIHGFVLSVLYSLYTFLKYTKVWEGRNSNDFYPIPGISSKISIIIIAHNSGKILEKCLDKLALNDKMTHPDNAEWILVDNASTDSALEATIAMYPKTKTIRNSENKGFAFAANQGFKAAKNKYLLYINTDVEVINTAVSSLVEILDKEQTAAVVGPRLYQQSLSIQKSVCPQPTIGHELLKPFFKLKADIREMFYKDAKAYSVPSIRGACFLIRKEALELVGGFDDNYFFYLEETDLFYRLRKKGWKVLYLPRSGVIHYSGMGSETVPFDRKKMYRESLMKYFKKNRPQWETLFLKKYWHFIGKNV